MNAKLEQLEAIESVMMLTDDALSLSQISNLIKKNLNITIDKAAVKGVLESHQTIFYKKGAKWKMNVGVD